MKYWYEILGEHRVDSAVKSAVYTGLRESVDVADLGFVLDPRIVWIRRSKWLEANPDQLDLTGRKAGYISFAQPVLGCVRLESVASDDRPSLYIDADQPPAEARNTVRHEVGHVLQARKRWHWKVSGAELEEGAERFARDGSSPFIDVGLDLDAARATVRARLASMRASLGQKSAPPFDKDAWIAAQLKRAADYRAAVAAAKTAGAKAEPVRVIEHDGLITKTLAY